MEKNIKKVISGMRPTGRLHLGNYFGALKNFINLQNEYECYFFIADIHAYTTSYEIKEYIKENSFLMIVDWLSAGLDPNKCTIFRQSDIVEHFQLHLILSMITPISWLLRNPTFKEQLIELYEKKYKGQEDKAKKSQGITRKIVEISSIDEKIQDAFLSEIAGYGFLGYPVLQTADILLYDADYVPVGKDQLPHIELARDIASRFNRLFSVKVFKEPSPLLTDITVLPGIDGKKMSKSYGNTIEIGENGDELYRKITKMFTDPKKIRANDPGNPDGCVVFAFHKIFNKDFSSVENDCRKGNIGCVKCKQNLYELINPWMKEIDEKRRYYLSKKDYILEIISSGNIKARKKASEKIREVYEAIGL